MSPFLSEQRLRFGQCDPSGIAYFPAYLDMLNGVIEEFWAHLGHPWPALMNRRRIGLPTVRLECDFSAPSMFDDRLVFGLTVVRLGRSSLELTHQIRCAGEPRWKARQIVVATSLDSHTAIAWPDDIRAALARFMEQTHAPHPAA